MKICISVLTAFFFLLATLANLYNVGLTFGTGCGFLSGLGFFIGTVLNLELSNVID